MIWTAIAFMQLAVLGGTVGWVLAAVFVGAVCGAGVRRVPVAIGAALGASALGAVWGLLTLSVDAISAVLPKLPKPVFQNVLSNALDSWYVPAVQSSVFVDGATGAALGQLLVAVVAAGGIAWLVARYAVDAPVWRRVAGWVAAAMPVVVLVIVIGNPASTSTLGTPLRPGSYGFDATLYRAAYENMVAGAPFYDAMVAAAQGDARLAQSGAVVNNQFVDFIKSAPQMRLPYPFQLWRAVAPNGAPGVMWFAALILGATMLLGHYVFERRIGALAALVSCALLLVALPVIAWDGLFFTEWWAGMLTVVAVLLWLREWRVAGVVAALAAAIFRDVALVTVVAMAVGGVVLALRPGAFRDQPASRRWAPLIAAGVAVVLFAGLYAVHAQQASAYIAKAESGSATVTKMLISSAKRDLVAKAINPAEFAQGTLWFSGLWIAAALLLQLPGWWFGIADHDRALRLANRVVCFGLAAFWLAVVLTIGATSPQWGMLFMPMAVVGTALLPAALELFGLGARAEVAEDADGPEFTLGV